MHIVYKNGLILSMKRLIKVVQIQIMMQTENGAQQKSMKMVNLSLNQENGDIVVIIVKGTKVINVTY